MKLEKLLIKYLSPFLLVAYASILMTIKMIWDENIGFGLPFIGFLLLFALCFLLLHLCFKSWFKNNVKIMLVLDAILALILLSASLYLEFKDMTAKPKKIEVQPVDNGE